MIRTEYITQAEYQEIVGTECDIKEIYEASEIMEYHMFDRLNTYSVLTAPTELKLATAYQLEYMKSGIDDDYASAGQSISLGKYSDSSSSNTSEYVKICPKSQRYLIAGGLLRRTV